MSIAALYDIHANLPALEAVLDEVPAGATILLGGDHVYGPFPAETLARLRALGDRAVWLRGNCDRELSEPGAGPASIDVLDWVRARLTDVDVAFLHGLPATVEIGSTLFCHATPANDVDFFGADTPDAELEPAFADVQAETFVCGHSHRQFDRRVAGRRVVNAGSVGMSQEDDPGACWALLGERVELRRTAFDARALATATDYPRPWWDA